MELDFDPLISKDLAISGRTVRMLDIDIYRKWLSEGQNGTMDYLNKDEGIMKREDPSLLGRDSRSVILFLLNYKKRGSRREGYGQIAKYATFKDYHNFFPKIIRKLVLDHHLFNDEFKVYVDTGPLLERYLAADASLGWIGRNSMLINKSIGSFTFIGAAVTDITLQPTLTPSPDLCGSCHRCIDACPTGAINTDRTINSNRCISYNTIENRGVIPKHVAMKMDDMVFGCDICNDVCPWNQGRSESSIPEVLEDSFSAKMKLEEIAFIDKEDFKRKYSGSALTRATHEGFARNAVVALYNRGETSTVRDVSRTLGGLRKGQADELLKN